MAFLLKQIKKKCTPSKDKHCDPFKEAALTTESAESWFVSISGTVKLGKVMFHGQFTVQDDDEGVGLYINLKVRNANEKDPITLKDLAESLCSNGALQGVLDSVDGGLKGFLDNVKFKNLEISVVTKPYFAFKVESTVNVYDLEFTGKIQIQQDPDTSKWGFGLGLQIEALGPQSLAQSIGDDFPQLANVKIAFASFGDHHFRFRDKGSEENQEVCEPPSCIQVQTGFVAIAEVDFTGPLEPVKKLLNIDSGFLTMRFEVMQMEFMIGVGISGTFPLGKRANMTSVMVSLVVSPQDIEMGIEGVFDVDLGKDNNPKIVKFKGRIAVGLAPPSLKLKAQMLSNWVAPFETEGLIVRKSTLEISFDLSTGVPLSFGIAGKVTVQDITYDFTAYIGISRPSLIFEFTISDFTLQKLLGLQGKGSSSADNSIVNQISFKQIHFAVCVTTLNSVKFNDKSYKSGFQLTVKEFNFFDYFMGSCLIKVQVDSILIHAKIKPFSIGGEYGLKIHGAEGDKSHFTFEVKVGDGPPRIDISTSASLAGLTMEARLLIDSINKVHIKLNFAIKIRQVTCFQIF